MLLQHNQSEVTTPEVNSFDENSRHSRHEDVPARQLQLDNSIETFAGARSARKPEDNQRNLKVEDQINSRNNRIRVHLEFPPPSEGPTSGKNTKTQNTGNRKEASPPTELQAKIIQEKLLKHDYADDISF